MSDPQLNTIPDAVQERWLPVEGFEGYEVSDLGRVRSFWKARGSAPGTFAQGSGMILGSAPRRILKPKIDRGYQLVTLYSDGRHHQFQVHRLVLLTFVGPPPPGHECCHKDGHRSNNFLTNLFWGTKSRNALDHFKHGNGPYRKGMDSPQAKLTDQQVIQIRDLFSQGSYSRTELGEMFNVHRVHIGAIIRRKAWPHIP